MKHAVLSLSLALLLGAAGQARAGLILGHVVEGTTAASNATIAANSTATGLGSIGSAAGYGAATFTTNSINYDDENGTDSVNAFLNSPTFSNTVGSFNANDPVSYSNNLSYGTYILFTGYIFLSAGNHTFTITHDDGAQLNIPGLVSNFGLTTPTSSDTETTPQINVATAGVYSFSLAYGEVNGLPAKLQFQVDGGNPTYVAPEPSTLVPASMAGLVGLGGAWVRRRRMKVAI
jgi:MYXO-CTERM domain-containing protein